MSTDPNVEAMVDAMAEQLKRGLPPKNMTSYSRHGFPQLTLMWVFPDGNKETKLRVMLAMGSVARALGADQVDMVVDTWMRSYAAGEEQLLRPAEDPMAVEALCAITFESLGAETAMTWRPYRRRDDGQVEWLDRNDDSPAAVDGTLDTALAFSWRDSLLPGRQTTALKKTMFALAFALRPTELSCMTMDDWTSSALDQP